MYSQRSDPMRVPATRTQKDCQAIITTAAVDPSFVALIPLHWFRRKIQKIDSQRFKIAPDLQQGNPTIRDQSYRSSKSFYYSWAQEKYHGFETYRYRNICTYLRSQEGLYTDTHVQTFLILLFPAELSKVPSISASKYVMQRCKRREVAAADSQRE